MNLRLLFLCLAVAIACATAIASAADLDLPLMGVSGGGAAPGFTGVCDLDASCKYFFGLVAAKAGSTAVAVDIGDGVSNTCTAIPVKADGTLDITGNFCNGNTQSVTTVCSTNCTTAGTFHVTKVYDQIAESVTCTAASVAVGPFFVLSGFNGQPTMHFLLGSSQVINCPTVTSTAVPWTLGATYSAYASTNRDILASGTGTVELLYANTTTMNCVGSAGASNNPQTATVAAATSATDFTHPNTVVMTVATSGSTLSCYPPGGGAAASASLSFTTALSTSYGLGARTSSNYSSAQISKWWVSNAAESPTVAQQITALAAP